MPDPLGSAFPRLAGQEDSGEDHVAVEADLTSGAQASSASGEQARTGSPSKEACGSPHRSDRRGFSRTTDAEKRHTPDRLLRRRRQGAFVRTGRQNNGDHGTAEIAIVADADPPTVCPDDAPNHRQPQPGSAGLTGSGLVEPYEPFEDPFSVG